MRRAPVTLLLVLFLGSVETGGEKHVLHVGSFYPLTGSFSSWGKGCLPAAKLAIDHINNRTDILPHHIIRLVDVDTQGSAGVTTRELFRMLYTPPTKVALLGPYLSHTSIAVAQTARWWHLLQVAPTPFTPELSNRDVYPYVFRIRAALTTFNPARVALVKSFGWRRVAILTRHTSYFIQTTDLLFKALTEANISVVTTEVYQTEDEPREELLRIKKLNGRIIFVFAYEEYARKIFCQIQKLGMYGSRYVWILHYSNDPFWMRKPTADGICTAQQIQEAAARHLVTRDVTLREDGVLPLAGMGTVEFVQQYRRRAAEMAYPAAEFYAPIVYDAVWTVALALNGSVGIAPPENFTYEDPHFTDVLMDQMDNMEFEGMTGAVKFSKSGEIATLQTKILQYMDDQYTTLGSHDALRGRLHWDTDVVWGGRVPFDDIQVRMTWIYVGDNTFYIMAAMATVGIVKSVFFLYYNIYYRKTRIVRMSSPNLNYLILLGGILTYCSVIFTGIAARPLPAASSIVTFHVKYLTVAVGFSLGFGALFARTWRVFKIFTSKSAKRLVISDNRLFAIVASFVAIDGFYFLLWFIMDPLYVTDVRGLAGETETDPDVVLVPWIRTSTSRNIEIWHMNLYIIKGLQLVFGAFLAWQTRGVSIAALNDSKYIGFAIYNVVTISLLAMLTSFIIDKHNVGVRYVITGSCIIVATAITQCLIFLPKMLGLRDARIQDETRAGNPGTSVDTTGVSYIRNGVGSDTTRVTNVRSGPVCKICKSRVDADVSPPRIG